MARGARLGQHFLTNPHYARELVRAARVTRGDVCLEIGPGTGALTRELLASGARVVAIEKDEALAAGLLVSFESEIAAGRLTIVSSDIRDIDPAKTDLLKEGYILAANIPYYITGEIIRQFLSADAQPRSIALLIQKEVADRIIAKKESILSISVKAYGTPKIAARVSRGNFSPPPSVDSAILAISDISKKRFDGISEDHFFDVVCSGFASKRKFLANNLAARFGKEATLEAFAACVIPAKARAEDLPLASWFSLSKALRS